MISVITVLPTHRRNRQHRRPIVFTHYLRWRFIFRMIKTILAAAVCRAIALFSRFRVRLATRYFLTDRDNVFLFLH